MNNIPIKDIKGVGPKIAGILSNKGIETVEDIFYFLPLRYEDRTDICTINKLYEGQKTSVVGTVTAYRSLYFRHSRKKAFEITIEDTTGTLSVKWFQWNRHYLKTICKKGKMLFVSGEVSRFGANLQMIHPNISIINAEDEAKACKTIIPVYTEIEGIKQGVLRKVINEAFELYKEHITSVVPGDIEKQLDLISLPDAFLGLHLPAKFHVSKKAALNRLVFEEYFLFQTALLIKKKEAKKGNGISFKTDGTLYRRFRNWLPFELTAAQKRVVSDIEHDMELDEPMNRLLEGDVGCGKTICAVLACCIAVDNGYQVAFMAPTEILAEQHYLSVHRFFDELGVSAAFLRGNMGNKRKGILERIGNGSISVVVGTHALIQKDVKFSKLGLVIIDEQHRFGVIQRKLLKQKTEEDGQTNPETAYQCDRVSAKAAMEDFQCVTHKPSPVNGFIPDTLVMSATPIPRTLSMVIYGDLDVSVIDELPKGRKRIITKIHLEDERAIVYKMIEEELKKGRQVYVVYPLVEESGRTELMDSKRMAAHFGKEVFPSYKIGLLHGRMKPQEKEAVMERFKDGNIDLLVCTTVIEVGIDVPNATMIAIEHAERFGLSQLHQLRGRVGRGIHASKCILIASAKKTDAAAKRLKIMQGTSDGFKIAEEDMKLRGPGDMLGSRQAGMPEFRVGDVMKDIDIMIDARKAAEQAISVLSSEKLGAIANKAHVRWKNGIHLFDVA